jgi:hypothetical protein
MPRVKKDKCGKNCCVVVIPEVKTVTEPLPIENCFETDCGNVKQIIMPYPLPLLANLCKL